MNTLIFAISICCISGLLTFFFIPHYQSIFFGFFGTLAIQIGLLVAHIVNKIRSILFRSKIKINSGIFNWNMKIKVLYKII
jgi:hypothetical protein